MPVRGHVRSKTEGRKPSVLQVWARTTQQRPILLETEAQRKSVFSLPLSFSQEKKKEELLEADNQSVMLFCADDFLYA